ncbi:MAG: GNAT family N-acetyltransferase [Faecousia sp.]
MINGKVMDMKKNTPVQDKSPCSVKVLGPEAYPAALTLIWDVFCQFEAPDYSEEGVQEFRAILDDNTKIRAMRFYGAMVGGELVGVLAMRKPQHVSLFFVKADHHRRGIGRRLFEAMKEDYDLKKFTVNASPYAVEAYRRLGFMPTDEEQVTNGIRYTPMVYQMKE